MAVALERTLALSVPSLLCVLCLLSVWFPLCLPCFATGHTLMALCHKPGHRPSHGDARRSSGTYPTSGKIGAWIPSHSHLSFGPWTFGEPSDARFSGRNANVIT